MQEVRRTFSRKQDSASHRGRFFRLIVCLAFKIKGPICNLFDKYEKSTVKHEEELSHQPKCFIAKVRKKAFKGRTMEMTNSKRKA